MLHLNQQIQKYLQKHRKQKRHAVIAVMLSFLVAFSVCGSLIMPAVSMTGSTEETELLDMAEENAVPLTAASSWTGASMQDGKPWRRFTWDEIRPGNTNGIDHKNGNVTGVSVTGFDNNGNVTSGNSTGKISFDYMLNESAGADVTKDNPTIYVSLSENIKVPDALIRDDWVGYITDDAYYNSIGEYAGEYVFVKGEDGKYYIVITYYDAYLEHVGNGSIKADLTFDATVSGDGSESGYKTIQIGDYTYYIGRDYGFDVTKQKNYDAASNKVTYTVNAYSPEGSGDEDTTVIIQDNLTDDKDYLTLNDDLVIALYTLNADGTKNSTQIIDASNYVTERNGDTFTVTGLPALADNSGYEITYSASVDTNKTGGLSVIEGVDNRVTVSSSDSTVTPGEAENKEPVFLNYGVTKKGEKVTYDDKTMIQWTVTVKNPLKKSMDGLVLTDDYLKDGITDAFPSNISVSSPSNTSITVTNNGTSGITINDSMNEGAYLEELVLTYYTDIPDDAKYVDLDYSIPNEVTLTDSSVDPPFKISGEDTVSYNPGYSIQKSGTADLANKKINWEITVNNPDGWDLNGFVVNDSLDGSNGFANAMFDSSNLYTVDKNNGTLTINSGVTDKTVTITYSTPIADETIYKADSTITSNTAMLKKGETQFDENTEPVTIQPHYSIHKVGTPKYKDGKIQWSVVVNNPDGIDLNGLDIVDVKLPTDAVVKAGDKTITVNKDAGETPSTPSSGAAGSQGSVVVSSTPQTYNLDKSKELESITVKFDMDKVSSGAYLNCEVKNDGNQIVYSGAQVNEDKSGIVSMYPDDKANTQISTSNDSITFQFPSGVTADTFELKYNGADIPIADVIINYVGGNDIGDNTDNTDYGNGTINTDGVTLTNLTSGYTIANGKLTFTSENKSQSIIITYETPVTDDTSTEDVDERYTQNSINNHAKLEKDTPIVENNATVVWNPNYTISKDGSKAEKNADGNFVYHWTIVAESTAGASLNGFKISDATTNHGFSHAVSGTLKVYDQDGTTVLTEGTDYSINENVITVSKNTAKITVTFDTPIDAANAGSDQSVENTAELRGPAEKPIISDTGEGTYDSGYDLTKTVTGAKTTDNKDWAFNWTITVTNENRYDLKEYYVIDDAFKSGMHITVKTGDTALQSGTDYEVVGDKLTFLSSITAASVEISYQTTVNTVPDDTGKHSIYESYSDTNTANFYAGSTVPIEDFATASYKPSYSLEKRVVSYDSADEVITWEITVTNGNNMSLDGFRIKDEYFDDLKESTSIDVKSGNTTLVENRDYTYLDNTITFNDITYHPVTITFTTDAEDCEVKNAAGEIVNTVELYKKDDVTPWKSAEATQSVTSRNELTKTKGNATKDGANQLIPWEIQIGRRTGDFYGLSYTDTMTANNSGEHYLTKAQAEMFQIVDSKTNTPLTGAYQIKWKVGENWVETSALTDTSQITAFQVTFVSNTDTNAGLLASVSDVKLSYTSTGNFASVPSNGTVNFTNTVEKDGDNDLPPASDTFSYTKPEAYVKYDANNWRQYHAWSIDSGQNFTNPNGVDYSQDQTYLDSELETDENGNYLLKWHIKVNSGVYGENEDITLTDTLPAGLSLSEDGLYPISKWENGVYQGQYNQETGWHIAGIDKNVNVGFCFKNSKGYPSFTEVNYTDFYEDYTTWGTGYGYSVNGQNVTFKIPGSVHQGKEFYIDYTAKISPTDLKALFTASKAGSDKTLGSVSFANTITDGTYGDETHAITVEESVIGKKGSQGAAGNSTNTVFYELDFNKDKLDLDPNRDFVTLEDILYSDDMYISKVDGTNQNQSDYVVDWYVKDGFAADLVNFAVYEINDATGAETKIDTYTVSVEYDPDKSAGGGEYAAKLTMQIPDGKHLLIKYSYHISRNYEDGYYTNGIPIYNKVNIQSNLVTQDTTHKDQYFLNQSSSATATTGGSSKSLKLAKKDAQTLVGLENAEFNLYAYNSNHWLLYTGKRVSSDKKTVDLFFYDEDGKQYYQCTETIDDAGNATWSLWNAVSDAGIPSDGILITGTDGTVDLPDIPTGVVFKAVEVQAPTQYMLNTDPTYFYYGSTRPSPPSDVTTVNGTWNNQSDPPLWNILNGQTLAIYNEKVNTISLPVSKVWADGAENHANDSVTIGLYRSHVAPDQVVGPGIYDDNGFPINIETVKNENVDYTIILNAENSWAGSFTDLPDKDSTGSYYYYVKELSYTHNGTSVDTTDSTQDDYIPSYTGNGQAYNSTVGTIGDITVTNSPLIDLAVKKVWKDSSGNEDATKSEEVTFQLHRYTKEDKSDDEVVTYENETSFTTQSKAFVFDNLPPSNNSGQLYHYYVVETSVNDAYSVEYSPAELTASGTLTMTNTPRTGSVSVQKKWLDNTGNLSLEGPSGSSITLELYRSTTAPAGQFKQSVNGLSYGANSITIDAATITGLGSAKIKSVTINADTSKFSEDCAKTATIPDVMPSGTSIDLSSGTGMCTLDTTVALTSPLVINSESASAITSIVLKFDGGEKVTITNTAPAQAEKPAGEVIYQVFTSGEVNVEIPSDYSSYDKKISKVEFKTSSELSYLGAWVIKDSGNTGWNTGFTMTGSSGSYVYTYTASAINAVDVGARGIGWNSSGGITEIVITFTDGTTFTIINSTQPQASSADNENDEPNSGTQVQATSATETQSVDLDVTSNADIPTGAISVGSITLDGTADENGELSAWKAQWNDLPYGDANDIYYYYVKETNTGGKELVGYQNNGQLVKENDQSEIDEIVVINESGETPATASLSIHKVWQDGNDVDRPSSVEVTLHRSTDGNLTLKDLNTTNTVVQDGIKNPVELNSNNGWSYSWTGLYRWTDNSRTVPYYYYVVETLPDGSEYTTTYSNDGKFNASNSTSGSITITNTKSGSITVNKEWVGGTASVDSVEMEVYRLEEKELTEKPTSLKVLALGDSITAGDGNGGAGYITHLQTELNKTEYGISINNDWKYGHSGFAIQKMPDGTDYTTGEQRNGILECLTSDFSGKNPDVVLLMAGTNDIISNYNNNIDGRLENLISAVYEKAPNATIFVANIPKFNFVNSDNSTTSSYTWFSYYSEKGTMTAQGLEDYINDTVIKNYNDKVKKLVTKLSGQGKKIAFVDIYNAVDKETQICSDGCHPNDAGNVAMAETWAKSIYDYYTVPPKNVAVAPPTKATLATDVGNNGVITVPKGDNDSWTATFDVPLTDDGGTKYIYYVKEKTAVSGYTVSYAANGQLADGTGNAITVTNTKEADKTSIKVVKTWVDGNNASGARPSSITINLLRKRQDASDWESDPYKTITLDSSKEWQYEWTDLLQTDTDGTQYLYCVEEMTAANGYHTTYSTNNTAGINSGTLTITNTKVVSLELEKQWSDENHNMADTVEVEIYRSISADAAPNDVEIIQPPLSLDLNEVTLIINGTAAVTANKTGITATSDDTGVATVSVSGGTITITGCKEGTTTIHVSDGKATKNISVTVSPEPTLNLSINPTTITAGDTATLTATMSDGSSCDGVWYESDATNVATVNGNTVTGVGKGEAQITAHLDGKTATVTITVNLSETFTLTGSNTVAAGSSIQLTPTPSYGTFTYSQESTDGGEVELTSNTDGTVTVKGKTAGTVTVIATRSDGETATLTVTVEEASEDVITLNSSSSEYFKKFDDGSNVQSVVIVFGDIVNNSTNDCGFDVSFNDGYVWVPYDGSNLSGTNWDGKISVSVSGKTVTFSNVSGNMSTITISKKSAIDSAVIKSITAYSSGTYSLRSSSSTLALVSAPVSLAAVAANDASESGYEFDENGKMKTTITLKSSDGSNWKETLNNLPAYDENGNPYYYWAVETKVNGQPISGYKPPQYSFDDGNGDTTYCMDASKLGAGKIIILNEKEDNFTTMPSTGGGGTRWYTMTGAAIICGATAAYIPIRRRRRRQRMK